MITVGTKLRQKKVSRDTALLLLVNSHIPHQNNGTVLPHLH